MSDDDANHIILPVQSTPRNGKADSIDPSVSPIAKPNNKKRKASVPSFSNALKRAKMPNLASGASSSSENDEVSSMSSSVSSSDSVPPAPVVEPDVSNEEVQGVATSVSRTLTSRYNTLTDHWETASLFPKNTIPNLMRLSRILVNAAADEDEDGDDDIVLTKEALPVVEEYLMTRIDQVIESAAKIYDVRGRKRVVPNDVTLAIQSNPVFQPFDISEFLQRHRDVAPAVVSFTHMLKAGKSKKKTERCVFAHTDVSTHVGRKQPPPPPHE